MDNVIIKYDLFITKIWKITDFIVSGKLIGDL